MTKTVSEILDAAADLIEPEGKWTQGCSARNAEGNSASATRPDAVCWCAAGAISRIAGGFFKEAAYKAHSALMRELPDVIPNWNDAPERTQAEVVAKLREAAAKARERGE